MYYVITILIGYDSHPQVCYTMILYALMMIQGQNLKKDNKKTWGISYDKLLWQN